MVIVFLGYLKEHERRYGTEEIHIVVDFDASAVAWTIDFSHQYFAINTEYHI